MKLALWLDTFAVRCMLHPSALSDLSDVFPPAPVVLTVSLPAQPPPPFLSCCLPTYTFSSHLSFSNLPALSFISFLLSDLLVLYTLTHTLVQWRCTARNVHVQQLLQPVDPRDVPGLVRSRVGSECDGRAASLLTQPSELTQPSSTGNRGAGTLPHAHHVGSLKGSGRLHLTVMAAAVLSVTSVQEVEPPLTNPPVFLFVVLITQVVFCIFLSFHPTPFYRNVWGFFCAQSFHLSSIAAAGSSGVGM